MAGRYDRLRPPRFIVTHSKGVFLGERSGDHGYTHRAPRSLASLAIVMIYFDHNATTPVAGEVLEAMRPYFGTFYGNPSSLHRLGRIARDAVERAREEVASLVGAQSREVIFTSGGTEANNWILKGFFWASGRAIAVSAIEHPSLLEPALALRERGAQVELIPVQRGGTIDLDTLELRLRSGRIGLVSCMWANNETGAIQPIREVSEICRRYGVLLHSDAVQAAGKIGVDFSLVDALTLSAHKLCGPKGVGALVVRRDFPLEPLLLGGGLLEARRAGTENVAGVVGFGCAAKMAREALPERSAKLLSLRKRLELGLKRLGGVTLFAEGSPRLPNTVQFALEGLDGETLVMELDKRGIAVSSGSACKSGRGSSHVLEAMGVGRELALGAVRVSLGAGNTPEEVDRFLAALEEIQETLRVW